MSDKLIDVKIEINADQLMKSLRRLQDGLKDKRPILETIGLDVAQWSRVRIESGKNRGPDGSVWAALKKSTVKNKVRKGLGHRGILQRYLDLTSSIRASDPTEDSVSVGSSLIYALIHQMGGKAGRGRKVTIPARPYLGVSEREKKLLEEKVTLWVKKLLES